MHQNDLSGAAEIGFRNTTHSGIVRALELAFPHAVNVLHPDLGHRDVPKPMMVTDGLLKDLAVSQP